MANPTVSVVMSVYNSEAFLESSINSVLTQTLGDFEFIVINDGSSDTSKDIISNFAALDNRIKVVTHKRNRGLIAGLNHGVQLATGKYIARQDADDVSSPSRLKKQVEYLHAHPEVGLVGTNYKVIDSDGTEVNATNVFTESDDVALAEIFSNQIGHGTILARAALLRYHLYDPDYKYAEDYDLWTKLARETKIVNLKESLYFWRLHGAGTTARKTAEMQAQLQRIRNREFDLFLKERRGLSLLSFHPFSIRGGPIAYCNKKASVYRDMALMYCYRGLRKRAVQALLTALVISPWSSKNYRQLLITAFQKSKIDQLDFEVI